MMSRVQPQLYILLLLVSFAAFSAILFTPALPEISKEFGLSSSLVQFTMTAFLFGYALGNLPYGPLANRFGRKPILYCGLALAALGSLFSLLAGSMHIFSILILGRFIEALGSAVGLKITYTMIGDVYTQTQATKKISALMISFALAPGIASALGGVLTLQFGWQSCFYFLMGYALLLLLLSTLLPETLKEKDVHALTYANVTTGFAQKIKNTRLVTCAFLMGLCASFIYLFAAEAPFIGIEKLGLRTDVYGYLSFIPPLGTVIGALCAHRLAGKKHSLWVITLGITIAFLGSLAMSTLFLTEKISIYSLFFPAPLIYLGTSLVFINASGLAMWHAKNKSNASATMSFLYVMVAALSLITLQALPKQFASLLPVFFFSLCLFMWGLRWILAGKIKAS